MRWTEGRTACEAIGGHLPKVTESGLQTQLLKLVGAIRSEVGVWIGYNNRGGFLSGSHEKKSRSRG